MMKRLLLAGLLAAVILPVAVLGSTAAERLGLDREGDRVLNGGRWYGVPGILENAGLAADIDASAIIGDRWVREQLDGGGENAAKPEATTWTPGASMEAMPAAARPASERRRRRMVIPSIRWWRCPRRSAAGRTGRRAPAAAS